MATIEVLKEVLAERERQDAKWGVQNHALPLWMTILMEEVGEAARVAISDAHGFSLSDRKHCRAELVQVAAVAVAAIESIDMDHARRCGAPSCPICESLRGEDQP